MKLSIILDKLTKVFNTMGDVEVGFKFFFKNYDITIEEKTYHNSPYSLYIKPTVIRGGEAFAWDTNNKIKFNHKFNIGDKFVFVDEDGKARTDSVKIIDFADYKRKLTYRGMYNREFVEKDMIPVDDTVVTNVEVFTHFKYGDIVTCDKGTGKIIDFNYTNLNGEEFISCVVEIGSNHWCCNEKGLVLEKNGYVAE